LILQLGAEPVAASWPAWLARTTAERWVLADHSWHDAESSARGVIVGDVAASLAALAVGARAPSGWAASWQALEHRAAEAVELALDAHPASEPATLRAAIAAAPAEAAIQLGNSLPIRVVDHVCTGERARAVLAQRGAAGIDGLIASAAGATRAGRPVLLVLGDVSFAHDLGGLLAARCATAPLAIVVIDNRGGRIFDDLPIARADLGGAFEAHFLTAPELDPAAVAIALGARAITAASPAAVAAAVGAALARPGVTVIHAPVPATSARDVRTAARAQLAPTPLRIVQGGAHD
jgi:2-succinyl-5-enolpyruvyl-6-hydroxy-3-cyclohexene-1-carboxylate synthase